MMTDFAAPLPILARYAVLVDVGYIYAAAGELLFGSSSRRDFRVDAVPLIQVITKHADEIIRGELLRVYWYDAARDRVPTIDQRVIAQMPWVKLRLGNLNARGQQKGVDAQIRADMEALARHRAITDSVLIAGDEDMVPAVEAAQAFGVRVHLWGIEPPYGTNQAERLVWESDTVDVLEGAFLRPYFVKNPTAVDPRSDQALGPSATTPTPLPSQLFGERHTRSATRTGGFPAIRDTGSFPAIRDTGPMPRLGPDRGRVEEAGEHVAQKWILTRGRDNIRDLLPGPILPPGHRQGTAGRRREGTRPVAAALPGGPRMAAGRVLGAGAPRVRHQHRQIPRLTMPHSAGDDQPILRVVRGDATPEEIAALVAVLVTRSADAEGSRPGPFGIWIVGETGPGSFAARCPPAPLAPLGAPASPADLPSVLVVMTTKTDERSW